MVRTSLRSRWYSLNGAAALFVAVIALAAGSVVSTQPRIKILLVTGQSNRYHNWEVSSPIVKRLLEDSGRFAVTVATTPPKGTAPNQDMSSFAPKFSDYQAVVLDYEGFEFAPPVKQAFVDYVKNGGGLVVLHAADNAFPGWAEYNEMIGVGGWGGFTPGYASRTQAARSSSARFAIASFFSSLLICGPRFPRSEADGVGVATPSIGSMIPNVIFDGS